MESRSKSKSVSGLVLGWIYVGVKGSPSSSCSLVRTRGVCRRKCEFLYWLRRACLDTAGQLKAGFPSLCETDRLGYEAAYEFVGDYCGGGERLIRQELISIVRTILKKGGIKLQRLFVEGSISRLRSHRSVRILPESLRLPDSCSSSFFS